MAQDLGHIFPLQEAFDITRKRPASATSSGVSLKSPKITQGPIQRSSKDNNSENMSALGMIGRGRILEIQSDQ